MDAARWQRIDEVFAAVLEQPVGQRGEFLERACGGDAELRREVESLLAHHRGDETLADAAAEAARILVASSRKPLVGRRLGPYEIVAPLGAGGMGEVYRARDTRLGRSVAIKVMPPHVAADPEARQRFEREARVISALAHPHICALHDVGSQDGVEFLVMELVEGETLAARLERGPVPLPDALRWAAQVADALDRAHRAGIVHRDLKPGNVMLTKSGVKLLDFGLARRSAAVAAGSQPRGSAGVAPLTAEGRILGTLQYMAPEQIEGRPVDQRADLFAFGAMLYELVTGEGPFDGATTAALISAVLRDTPAPVSTRAPLAPPALDALVQQCLAKDPEERWQSAHDLKLQLLAIAAQKSIAAVAATERRPWLAGAVAAMVVAVAAGAALLARRRPAPVLAPAVRFELSHPGGGRYYYSVESTTLAWSPDGSLLAFITLGPSANSTSIWVRPLADLAARPVPGTEGALSLFWSPDGESLGFVADGKLKRVSLAGGPPVVLCDVERGVGVSGTWGRSSILIATVQSNVLRRVPVDGGAPVDALRADSSRGELALKWPWFLPDGERFLYLAAKEDGTHELRLAGGRGQPRTVGPVGSRVELVDPGFAVFTREGALIAQRFDPERAVLEGAPLPLVPAVRGVGSTGLAAFATSRRGTLAVATHEDLYRLTLLAPDGRPVGTVGERASAWSMAASADGRRAIVARLRPGLLTYDLWMLDLERGIETQLTDAPGTESYPLWLPGGGKIVYSRKLGAAPNLALRDLASGRDEVLLPEGPFQLAAAVTPDGRRLLYRQRRLDASGIFELFSLPLDGTGAPLPVLRPGLAVSDAAVSRDGRLLAYISPERSRPELFVRLLEGGESMRVSVEGAGTARFSPDGRTLFFTTPDRHLAAVSVAAGPSLALGMPVVRFALPPLGWMDFNVLPDGRFLALVKEVDGMQAPLTIITGWNVAR